MLQADKEVRHLTNLQPGDSITLRLNLAPHRIIYILHAYNERIIDMPIQQLSFLDQVRDSGKWACDADRTQTFTVGPNWSLDAFVHRLKAQIEAVILPSE